MTEGGLAHKAHDPSGRDAGEAEDQLHRRAVRQTRHLVVGRHPRDDALDPVPVAELVTGLEGLRAGELAGAGPAHQHGVLEGVAVPGHQGGEEIPAAPEAGRLRLETGPHEGGLSLFGRHPLAHHVDAHEHAVAVVVLEEGHAGAGHSQSRRRLSVDDHESAVPDLRAPGNREDAADVGSFGCLEGAGAAEVTGGEDLLAIGDQDLTQMRGPGQPVGAVERLGGRGQEGVEPVPQRRQGSHEGPVEGRVPRDQPQSGLDECRQPVAETGDARLRQVVAVGHGKHDELGAAGGAGRSLEGGPRRRQAGPAVLIRALGQPEDALLVRCGEAGVLDLEVPLCGAAGEDDAAGVLAGRLGPVRAHAQPPGQQLGKAPVQEFVEGRLVPGVGRCGSHASLPPSRSPARARTERSLCGHGGSGTSPCPRGCPARRPPGGCPGGRRRPGG